MNEINLAKRFSHALFHFVNARAKQHTDHKMSCLPIRDKYKRLRTLQEQTFDNSPTFFPFLVLLVVVEAKCGDFV